jgi:RNA-binding protein
MEKISERVAGKVDVQLGKRGITEAFLKELENRLKHQRVVKIRLLKSFRRFSGQSIEDVASYLAEKTNSKVYEIRGFTLILVKED